MSDLKEDQYIIGMKSFTNAAKISISRGQEEALCVYRLPYESAQGRLEFILALGEHPEAR